MNKKNIVLELTGTEDFPLEVEWSYSNGRDHVKRHTLPFNLDDGEGEIIIPDDLEQQLKDFAIGTLIPRWLKEIENQISNLEFDGVPALWQEYQDEAQTCERENREER